MPQFRIHWFRHFTVTRKRAYSSHPAPIIASEAQRTIKQQNEQLQQTLQARDKLYSVIAHDLRSPIGTIKMINAAIETEKEKITNPSIRKKFEMINETTEEAYNLPGKFITLDT